MPFGIWMQGIALQLWIRQDIGNRDLDQRDVLRFGDLAVEIRRRQILKYGAHRARVWRCHLSSIRCADRVGCRTIRADGKVILFAALFVIASRRHPSRGETSGLFAQ